MVITGITSQLKKDKFNIFVDGKYLFSISKEDAVKEKLKVGLELDVSKYQRLKFLGIVSDLFVRSVNFLSFRPRSEKEVLDKLSEVLYKNDEISNDEKGIAKKTVIEKLKSLRFVNDEEFAKWFITARRNQGRPKGSFVIKRELIQKGVSKDLVESLLSEPSEKKDSDLAFVAAEKKVKSFRNLEKKVFKERLIRYLLGLGYEWDVVSGVVDTFVKRQYNESRLDNGKD